MPAIIRNLPYSDEVEHITVRQNHQRVVVKPYQIMFWISLASAGDDRPPGDDQAFPAVLRTGFSHNLLLSEEHLTNWACIPLIAGQVTDKIEVPNGRGITKAPLLPMNIWLHEAARGRRDVPGRAVACLELDGGIAVYPKGEPDPPRLPFFGLRSLEEGNYRITVHCGPPFRVSVHSQGLFLRFLGW